MTTTEKINIAQCIEQILYKQDNLVIPGLGIFTSKPVQATIDYLGETISPPTKVLAFDETVQSDDGILLQFLVEEVQMTQTDARVAIDSYVQEMKTILDNREIVNIPRVGRLYKNYARKIQFLPETTNFKAESFGLPPVQATATHMSNAHANQQQLVAAPDLAAAEPKKNITESTPKTDRTTSYQTTDYSRTTQTNKTLWAWLSAGLLALGLGLGFMLMQKKKTQVAATPKIDMESPAIAPIGSPLTSAQMALEAEANKQKEQPAIASPKDDIPDVVSGVADQKAAEKAKSAMTKQEKAPKSSETTDAAEQKSTTDLGAGKRCVLVLGAFEGKENADKLIQKLKAKDYNTYHRRDEKNRHQVGVEFMYTDLRDIQKNIEDLQALTGLNSIWIKRR
jgi:cell division septation protein DedD